MPSLMFLRNSIVYFMPPGRCPMLVRLADGLVGIEDPDSDRVTWYRITGDPPALVEVERTREPA